MRILFITLADLASRVYGDGSTRYRCFNVAEVAKGYGVHATVMQMDQVKSADLKHFDLVSWLRPEASRKFLHLVNQARQLGIRCIADVDDLIFDPALCASCPAVINALSTQWSVRKRFASHAKALSCVDAITVSTTALQQHVTRLFPTIPVYTLHNGLSAYWLSWVEQCRPAAHPAKLVTYLPGTQSHDKDFRSVSLALSRWLRTQPQARLSVVGKLAIDSHMLPAGRWSQHPWTDYFQLPATIVNCAATLAPLEDTLFNAAKSHVKFIESAALGVPLIASPIPDLAQHSAEGLHLVKTAEQWVSALHMATDAVQNQERRVALKRYARSCCTAEVYCKPLLEAWMQGKTVPACAPPAQTAARAA